MLRGPQACGFSLTKGIRVRVQGLKPHPKKTGSIPLMKPSSVRTSTKGGNTALKRYKALKHVILCPTAITKIARNVLVMISLHYALIGEPSEKTSMPSKVKHNLSKKVSKLT